MYQSSGDPLWSHYVDSNGLDSVFDNSISRSNHFLLVRFSLLRSPELSEGNHGVLFEAWTFEEVPFADVL